MPHTLITRNSSYKPTDVIIDLTEDNDSDDNTTLLPPSNHGLLLSEPTFGRSHFNDASFGDSNGRPPPILPGATLENRFPNSMDNRPSKRRRVGAAHFEQKPTRSMNTPVQQYVTEHPSTLKKTSISVILPQPKASALRDSNAPPPQTPNGNHLQASHHNSSSPSVQINERFSQVLHEQVFIHINAAMVRHERFIDGAKLKDIGTKVAGVLVDNPTFENLNRYGGVLSVEDERVISEKARHYVDNFVAQSLALPDVEPGYDADETIFDREESDEVGISSNQTISAPKDSTSPIGGRTYSSSPTTSFGSDATITTDTRNGEPKTRRKKTPIIQPATRVLTRTKRPRQASSARISRSPIELPPSVNSFISPYPLVEETLIEETSLCDNFMDVDGSADIGSTSNLPAANLNIVVETSRPYLDFKTRENIWRGLERASGKRETGSFLKDREVEVLGNSIYHVDFCHEELSFIHKILASQLPQLQTETSLPRLIQTQKLHIPELVKQLSSQLQTPPNDVGGRLIHNRGLDSLTSFFKDAKAGKLNIHPRTLQFGSVTKRSYSNISSVLRQREIHGMAPVRSCRGQKSYAREICCMMEDSLQRKLEWTDCCGDIWAVAWTSHDAFVCGATAHSDSHNMQYNKPGNLVVGSVSKEALDAIPDHRIVRPKVSANENLENALDSMRQTQDPWLYTSISAISHSQKSGYTFTASLDGTVKIWKVSPSETGSSMDIQGTWPHEGKVNFVVTSEHHDLVATASDVHNNAIRIYQFDESNIMNSEFINYNGDKAAEQSQELQGEVKWAYYPATIQWGKAEAASHLLLVGYSPRATSGDEVDIPEDKRNSGELCMWNTLDGSKVTIVSARTQNVFEVMWHPTRDSFIAATSPCGTFESETRTQIRLFNRNGAAFTCARVLDCPACDINELTIMPNSYRQCYITASCTDGNTYVWDSGAAGDGAIHVLRHGESLDNPVHDLPREIADTGVKFAAWGKSADRFYTGGSDGRVNAWDIQKPPGKALVREVLAASGGISAGVFSADFSMLLIGDATGKVHLLARSEDDPELEESEDESTPAQPSRGGLYTAPRYRGPRMIKHHPEPPPPEDYEVQTPETGVEISREFLQEGFLTLNPDPVVGAVQGPRYSELGLFRFEAHEDEDGEKPLLPYYQARQQRDIHINMEVERPPCLPVLTIGSELTTHLRNLDLDREIGNLGNIIRKEMNGDKVEFMSSDDHDFELEIKPNYEIFARFKGNRSDRHPINPKENPKT